MVPSTPAAPGGVLGNALSGNVAGKGVANAAQASDLIGLLSQASEQIDEPKEIEIGRQLAASAGFDPYGLVAVLQQLRTVAPDNTAFTLTMSTHPPTQLRMDQVELAMGNRLAAFSGKAAVTVGQRMEQLAAAEQRMNSATAVAPAIKAAPAPAGKPAAKPPAKPAATVKKPTS